MQERFIRWSIGVDWRTPGYMVREETNRKKLRTWAWGRAWRYVEKLSRGESRLCLPEIRDRGREAGVEISAWERERKEFRGKGGGGEKGKGATKKRRRKTVGNRRRREEGK